MFRQLRSTTLKMTPILPKRPPRQPKMAQRGPPRGSQATTAQDDPLSTPTSAPSGSLTDSPEK
eukprot:9499284-Pyramimonas_sp.AAC.2